MDKNPTTEDLEDGYEECDLIDDYNLPAHWLMMQMNNYCVGANYVFLTESIIIQCIMYSFLIDGYLMKFYEMM
jgi:hypothetical protein